MCAQIFPIKEDISEMPYSEFQVYEMLEKLDEKFVVFHSVQWLKKSNKWKSTWKENDFLILHRNLGAIVLEVKGGEIEYSGTVFHQINTQTHDVSVLDPKKKKDPLSQAIDGVYHYRKLFDTICPDLDNRFSVEAAVCFPSCKIETKRDKFPLAYREASGAVLGIEDLEKGPQVIRDVFDFYGSRNKVNITDDEFKKMVDLIATDFELITAPGVRKGELDHAFLKLTNEQLGLLDYISEQNNATIQGVAGTGKTLIAKEAARRFGLEGRKVLFLCFNKFLYTFLKRKYPYENVKYYNIHMLISEFSKHGIDLSNSVKRAKVLLEIDWDLLKYDDVIIDEAQDFHNDEIIYFKELVELRNGHFFVFYDKNQLLTTQEVPVWIRDSEANFF